MHTIDALKKKILAGEKITKEEALLLTHAPLEPLCTAADELRRTFAGNGFDLCSIINGKSGRCSEDCKYCAQSAHYQTRTDCYSLLSSEEILKLAKYNEEKGILRYSIVTSGKRLSDSEVEALCQSVRILRRETNLQICVSAGLLDEKNYRKLKEAGVSRIHNNLETSARYFPQVCTTHTYQEKIEAIQAAKRAGLSVCSGGILGLGESMEDRIDMACQIRELGVSSIPVNVLNPIPGTPYEGNSRLTEEELRRTVAIFRFLLPAASIRLAGGRGLLPDNGKRCFTSGANAAISGDMLTTVGNTIEKDRQLIQSLGYQVQLSQDLPIPPAKGLFITGNDTDIGKTYVAALLVKALQDAGLAPAYFKAAISGIETDEHGEVRSDASYVREISGIDASLEEMCPYTYTQAVSPHLACQTEGNPVDLSVIQEKFAAICQTHPYVVMEGSGGILCPLRQDTQEIWLEDVIRALGLSSVLVADAGLGTINHTLLTVFYMEKKGLPVKGILYNNYHPGNAMEEDNIAMIEKYTGLPTIARIKPGDTRLEISAAKLASYFEPIQGEKLCD